MKPTTYFDPVQTYGSANDTTDLCLLGILFNDARTIKGLIAAVRQLGTQSWHPTADVISIALERLIKVGHVVSLQAGNDTYYSITGHGIKQFFVLMKRPLGSGSMTTQNTLALKSAFLEIIPTRVQRQTIQELIDYYSCKLNCLKKDCENCFFYTTRQKLSQDQQINEIRTELNWLQGLTHQLPSQSAH
ncbi:hypothetical protein RYZ26_13985 [Terasakiella sp. A23]|uniref:hypothetical protein n=1 Tax=Terasakiella sp. FCG-A23 TaxID=3080561 RepID=UPI002953FEFE|nr:hypothetical protein [Terasakiella sp. A23]MDV7340711.1 hypothetical protein [Terasakiella sp. A23]